MPESNFSLYRPDARKNFDAVRPAPICTDASPAMGQCHNIHISTNCYYGYHDPKRIENVQINTDCEMLEPPIEKGLSPMQTTTRKRSADNSDYPKSKRLRDDADTEDLIMFIFQDSLEQIIPDYDDSSMCSLVGTRSSPSHSASAFNVNMPTFYMLYLTYRFSFRVTVN